MADGKSTTNGKPEGFADDLEKAWDDAPEDDSEVETADEEPEGEESEVEEVEDGLTPPEHWSAADKEAFKALPEEARKPYLDARSSIESGYNSKFQELAAEKKKFGKYQPFDDIFAPYQQELDRLGMTPDTYIRQIMATAAALRDKPKETLAELARVYGVDFSGQAQAAEEEYLDPAAAAEIRRLNAELSTVRKEVKDSLGSVTQAQQTASQRQVDDQWRAFASTSENGKPLFPHADRLKVRIGTELQLMSKEEVDGKAMPEILKIAYSRAAWADDAARQDMMKTSVDLKRKAEVQKAKKAGRVVRSKSDEAPKTPSKAGSWKEGLEETWDQLSG